MKARRWVVAVVAVAAVVVFWAWPSAPGPVGGWMAAAGVAPRYETVEGLRLRYVRRGSGPPVVLLHGLASSLYTWKDVLPALAARHDVIAVDLPGFGGSDIAPTAGMDALLLPVAGLMDRLDIARASLVGNSLGGGVAVALAAHHPERVERVVLIDAAGFNLAREDRPWVLRLLGDVPASLVRRAPVRPFIALGLRQVFHDDRLVTSDRIDEYVVPMLRPGAREAVHRFLATAETLGFPAVISRVRAPTLILWGRYDAWIPVRDAERFAAAIPGARVVLLEAGHMPQEERPAEVAAAIAEFLAAPAGVH